MPTTVDRRTFCRFVARVGTVAGAILAGSCSGGSYAGTSGSPVVPTNVAGKSDTSGISAGAALQVAGVTPSPTK
jgi:hypothetical protein